MKTCSECSILKNDDDFSFRNKKSNIRNSKCKVCHAEYVRTHYAQNKSKYIKRAKASSVEYRKDTRQKMLEYLSDKKCKDCEISDIRVLDFDHRNSKSKRKSVAQMMRNCSWNTILQEIHKCDIRCANCHRIRTSKQFNWYKQHEFDR